MVRITEKILEPSTIYVNDRFTLKIKVDDYYLKKRVFVTEDGRKVMTEDDKDIRTEWGNN